MNRRIGEILDTNLVRALFVLPIAASLVACSATPSTIPKSSLLIDPDRYPDTTSIWLQSGDTRLVETYFDDDPDALRNTRSVTKSVTMLAVGAALQSSTIDSVDDPIGKYFAKSHRVNSRHDGYADITIRDLLTMSSALECDDSDRESAGQEENMYPQPNWGKWIYDLPLEQESTGNWRYCTAGVVLLGKTVEAASGLAIDQFTENEILKPIGIERQNWFRSEAREPMTGGGLELTTQGYANLAKLLLSGGVWHGERLIPREFVEQAMTVHNPARDGDNYGYLLWQSTYATPCGSLNGWRMSGNGGNVALLFPAIDSFAVITRTHYNQPEMHDQTRHLLESELIPLLDLCG